MQADPRLQANVPLQFNCDGIGGGQKMPITSSICGFMCGSCARNWKVIPINPSIC